MNRDLLETRQLLAFSTLADTGSFTEAAKRLYLTQSAVSHSIRSLEEQLGCKLFDRVGKKAQLTEAGERLLRHTMSIFNEMDVAVQSIEEVKAWGTGRIRIGASTTACRYILPNVLREFRESFPRCNVVIEPGDTPVILEGLASNQIDLGFCLKPWKEIDFETKLMFEDHMQLVVAPSHPLAECRTLSAEYSNFPFIVYNKNSYTFDMVNSYFQKEKIEIGQTIELSSVDAIKELVKIGLGIGVLAEWNIKDELRDGSMVTLPMGNNVITREWVICKQRTHVSNLMENTFESLCRSVSSALVA
ncbi:MAG: LysR family transcriptional regulator [Opitutales bacterium]|nr:LysR family transcriptional regulator [Opitutales bacterium]